MESGTSSSDGMSKKRSSEKDFEVLRDYILACPSIPSSAPAVKAALTGLENEMKRRERDAKLQKKFAKSATLNSNNNSAESSLTASKPDDDEWQEIANEQKSSAAAAANTPSAEIPDDEVEIIDMESDTSESALGKELAEAAISSIAESHARANTPVSALALALHASMRAVDFACTGVPDDNTNAKSGGFAAPIRELPKTQFLPRNWEKDAPGKVTLRYRKNGTGSILLKLERQLEPSSNAYNTCNDVCVKLVPANTQEPPSESLTFPLDRHINLDSFNAALRASPSLGVEPSLHYKGLPSLLTSFSRTFDLGSVKDQKNSTTSTTVEPTNFIGVQVPKQPPTHGGMCKPDVFGNGVTDPLRVGGVGGPRRMYDERTPTIGSAFPQPAFASGDFAGDLNPLGNMGGLNPLQRPGPDNAGNLMGPNHPAFHGGGGMPGVGGQSGFGMMPRYDPFGPPGGPQEIHPPLGPDGRPSRGRPGGTGVPNNDILKPPNTLGNNNMFS